MTRPLTLARTAGVLYLLLAVLGSWAQLVARGSVYVPDDAAATAAGIVEHETLFRLSLVADILMAVVFVLLGLALFRLLDDVHRRAGTALLVFVAVGAGSILVNVTFQVGALITATDPAYDDATTLLLLDLHAYGYALGGVFFGLWLLPMGWAAVRTTLFPTWLGVLLIAGSVAWVLDPVALQRAEIVGVAELGPERFEDRPVALLTLDADLLRQVSLEIRGNAIVVEQRVVDVNQENNGHG